MRIVVVGGTGRVGSKVVQQLVTRGHEVVAAAPSTGVDAVSTAGLSAVLDGAAVVVDTSNLPSSDSDAAREFFVTATLNLLSAGERAGVGHHVVLSMVGIDRLAAVSGYHAAKLLQEHLVAAGPLPFTIVRSTPCFESVLGAVESGRRGPVLRLPPALVQPIASADAAEALAVAAVGAPVTDVVEVSGPRTYRLDAMVRTALVARGDRRRVIADPSAPLGEIPVGERTLLPGSGAVRFETRFEDWLIRSIIGR
ncbi:SDR family oxidoreductase [Mycolicibacterium bacteremicum]|uniref:NmrA family transcriptional regulator n=1 Tax=Mycolicibacterium bacteremicum TaxID=564198 RepID=A0A1W9YTE6_MYCBA|nr:NAD(P)H-binding protein [Mycolicibacterium bacteremicum]MCV7432995.1 NAD(P)H-binding protein [Mycolicibacterium bacteremicum]ORA03324.1 NmrA family transcriptional regulator [Mycolicibacterium bacteremicum]